MATALPSCLRERLFSKATHAEVTADLAHRGCNLLRDLKDGVLSVPERPYRSLLGHAGIKEGDLRELVRAEGVEVTLERLHESGVDVSLDEFKGQMPIQRGSLERSAT